MGTAKIEYLAHTNRNVSFVSAVYIDCTENCKDSENCIEGVGGLIAEKNGYDILGMKGKEGILFKLELDGGPLRMKFKWDVRDKMKDFFPYLFEEKYVSCPALLRKFKLNGFLKENKEIPILEEDDRIYEGVFEII